MLVYNENVCIEVVPSLPNFKLQPQESIRLIDDLTYKQMKGQQPAEVT